MTSHFGNPVHLSGQLARLVASTLPASFNGDGGLFALNLFLMTAFTCLGALLAGGKARAIWSNRRSDALLHPLTVWRAGWMFAGLGLFLRCGTEAMTLWAWNPADVETTARVLMAKRWLDPASLVFATCWMGLVLLADAGMTEQLTKRSYPVRLLASLPMLRRPLAIVALSLIGAIGVAVTR